MPKNSRAIGPSVHRTIATDLFNETWALLDRKQRTREENDRMVHAAHASRYHWGRVGTARNRSVGEWQISRVYSVLGRSEPALHHGRRALEIAQRGHLGRFYVAYGYEALARAAGIRGDRPDRDRYLRQAQRIGEQVRNSDDRRVLFEDLATIPRNGRPKAER